MEKEPKLCECGCDLYCEPNRRFIHGHNGRGRHHSKETKEKIGIAHLGIPESKEANLKNSLGHKGQVPWIKGKYHTKESKEKMRLAKSKNKELQRKAMREIWKDPVFREKRIQSITKGMNKPETKKKIDKLRKDPEYLIKLSKGHKRFWNNLSKEDRFTRINKILSRVRYSAPSSKAQTKLYNFIKSIFPTAIHNHKIFCPYTKSNKMFLDIAIAEYMLNFEYDSNSYHKNRNGIDFEKRDRIRDEYLQSQGWTIVRIVEKDLKTFVGE
jgi:hypothetical protein